MHENAYECLINQYNETEVHVIMRNVADNGGTAQVIKVMAIVFIHFIFFCFVLFYFILFLFYFGCKTCFPKIFERFWDNDNNFCLQKCNAGYILYFCLQKG